MDSLTEAAKARRIGTIHHTGGEVAEAMVKISEELYWAFVAANLGGFVLPSEKVGVVFVEIGTFKGHSNWRDILQSEAEEVI
jgi:hypothetical protein